jgi:hypothetical protein
MNEQKEGWEKSFEQRIRNIFTLLIADAKDRHRNTYHIWAKDPDEAFEIIKKEIKFLRSKDHDTLIAKIEKEIEQSNFEGVNGEYQGGKLQAFDKVKQIILEVYK